MSYASKAFFAKLVKLGFAYFILTSIAGYAWAGPTSTTLSVSPNPAYVSQSITLTATVNGSSPTGTVTFKNGSTTLGTGTVSGGQATFSTSFASTGNRNLTAVYGGDAGNSASTSSAVSLSVVAKVTTSTQLTASPNPAQVGQNILLTATVTGTNPSGIVTFKSGSTALGTGTVTAGQATFTASFATSGSKSLTAKYEGDVANNTSTSTAVSESVVKADTSTTLVSDANPAFVGQSITLTATVSGNTPSGTVTFKNGSTTLGTGTVAGGQATFTTSFPTTGTKSLTARYDGDAGNNTSTSTALAQVVSAKNASSVTLASGINPAKTGQAVQLTATVNGTNPTGTVTFLDGGTALGTAAIASGQASLNVAFGTPGSHSLTASYGGDTAHNGSTSSAVNEILTADTTTTLFSNASPAYAGQSVTLTAMVAGGNPSGTVTFRDGTTSLGSVSLSSGVAALSISFLGAGNRNLTANFLGNSQYNASTSATLVQVVDSGFSSSMPGTPASPVVVTDYEYDAEGHHTRTTRAPGMAGFGFQSTKTYDSLSRLKEASDFKTGMTRFSYDGQEALTQVLDPRNLATQYPRDGLGQATQVNSPDTGLASNTYDAAGNLKTYTDSRGATATYSYDARNRLTQAVFAMAGQSSQTFGWAYDQTGSGFSNGRGRLTSMTSPAGSAQFAYDPLGRLVTASQRVEPAAGANTSALVHTVTYEYDSAGRLIGLTYPSGAKLVIDYLTGRPSALTLLPASGSTIPLVQQIALDPAGRLHAWRWAATGQINERVYDASGRLIRYRMGPIARDLVYDAGGRTTGYTHYDAASAAPIANLDQSFAYDAAGQVTGINAATSSWTIAYDANGNRTGVALNGVTTGYTVASTSNRLTATSNPARSFGYDAAGNTLSDTGGYTAGYDAGGRLATLTKAGVSTTYDYNNAGQRIRKYNSAGTVVFVYDQRGQLLGEYSSTGAVIREYVWLGDMPVAAFMPNANNLAGPPLVYFFHTDHLNTPRVVTDTTGNIRWRWFAEPFGTTAPETNPSGLGVFTQPLRFPGMYADQESGLFFNWHRYFDPSKGGYPSADPIGLAGGSSSLYPYANNNPVSFIDPNGLQVAPSPIGPIPIPPIGPMPGLPKPRPIDPLEPNGPTYTPGPRMPSLPGWLNRLLMSPAERCEADCEKTYDTEIEECRAYSAMTGDKYTYVACKKRAERHLSECMADCPKECK